MSVERTEALLMVDELTGRLLAPARRSVLKGGGLALGGLGRRDNANRRGERVSHGGAGVSIVDAAAASVLLLVDVADEHLW